MGGCWGAGKEEFSSTGRIPSVCTPEPRVLAQRPPYPCLHPQHAALAHAPQALGSKGLAVSVLPPESTLEPWNRLVLVVSCFNDMCGAYMDKLHVKVGVATRNVGDPCPCCKALSARKSCTTGTIGRQSTPYSSCVVMGCDRRMAPHFHALTQPSLSPLPQVGDLAAKEIPVLVGVAGTPLVVQPERVLVRGLRERQWRTALDWGQLPRGVEASKSLYVFNTGSLGKLAGPGAGGGGSWRNRFHTLLRGHRWCGASGEQGGIAESVLSPPACVREDMYAEASRNTHGCPWTLPRPPDMHLSWAMKRLWDYPDFEHLPPTTDEGAGGTGHGCSLWGGPERPRGLRDARPGFQLLDVRLEADERRGGVRLVAERHADPYGEPFVVEPKEMVGGGRFRGAKRGLATLALKGLAVSPPILEGQAQGLARPL